MEVLARRPQPGDLLRNEGARLRRPRQVGNDLADAEHADRQGRDVDTVGQLGDAEREAGPAGIAVGADEAHQQAEDDHGDRLDHRAMGEHHRGHEAEHHQREILGRTERLADDGERRREHRDQQGRDAAGEERAERGHGERRAGAALPRHLVAIDAGHDRRGLARQIHQDRGGRTAVLRAVEDAGEHDQPRRGLEMERQRQQHRDGGDRTDAGQHADQGPDQSADQREEDVRPGQRDVEAYAEIVQELHGVTIPARPGSSARARG